MSQRWGQFTGTGGSPDTQGLKLAMYGAPNYTTITPVEHKGPIVAKMDLAPGRRSTMNVNPVPQSLGVQINVDMNGMKGLGQTLRVPGPRSWGSDIVQDFDLDIGLPERKYTVHKDFLPHLETINNGHERCVRLREAEFTAEFSLDVILTGSVAFNGWFGAQLVPIGDIVSGLKTNDRDGSFRRFQMVDNGVVWTVSGRCHFYLTT